MTTEEAIKELKRRCIGCNALVGGNNDCADCEYRMAIEALEKQILKKLMGNEKKFSPVKCAYIGRCSNCHKVVDDTLKYCWNCGQALD